MHGTDESGSAGKVIARLLNTAVAAGKRARAETSISKGKSGCCAAASVEAEISSSSMLGTDEIVLRSSYSIGGAFVAYFNLSSCNHLPIRAVGNWDGK